MLNILVDYDIAAGRAALPGTTWIARQLQVDPAVLADKVAECVEAVGTAFAKVEASDSPFSVGSITFTLSVSGEGEVSVVSVVKANATVQSGLQVTLVPKVPHGSRA